MEEMEGDSNGRHEVVGRVDWKETEEWEKE